jgi:hypothetical protein
MSQILQGVPASGFVLVPIRILPVQDEAALAVVMQTYERARKETQALSRPAITDRLFAASWN